MEQAQQDNVSLPALLSSVRQEHRTQSWRSRNEGPVDSSVFTHMSYA